MTVFLIHMRARKQILFLFCRRQLRKSHPMEVGAVRWFETLKRRDKVCSRNKGRLIFLRHPEHFYANSLIPLNYAVVICYLIKLQNWSFCRLFSLSLNSFFARLKLYVINQIHSPALLFRFKWSWNICVFYLKTYFIIWTPTGVFLLNKKGFIR